LEIGPYQNERRGQGTEKNERFLIAGLGNGSNIQKAISTDGFLGVVQIVAGDLVHLGKAIFNIVTITTASACGNSGSSSANFSLTQQFKCARFL
jgi:hypothetical protein